MDAAHELGAFLRTRRARVTPEQVGLPDFGERRVAGLRREEAAMLSGVSVDYYRRIERGLASGASDDVLASIARALRMSPAEGDHLRNLARAVPPQPAVADASPPPVRPAVLRLLESQTAPAFLLSRHADFLAANALGRALYAPIFASEPAPPNFARFCFLDPVAREFYVDWERSCRDVVAHLRSEAGRDPRDHDLAALIGELSTHSREFATSGPPTTCATTRRGPRSSATPWSA